MSEDKIEQTLNEEEKIIEAKIMKSLSDSLGVMVESADQFKLMAIPTEDPNKSVLSIVFLPHKEGLSQTALAVNFTDIAAFIIDCSKEYMKKHARPATEINDRMMVS